jgi:hypothetical protein
MAGDSHGSDESIRVALRRRDLLALGFGVRDTESHDNVEHRGFVTSVTARAISSTPTKRSPQS